MLSGVLTRYNRRGLDRGLGNTTLLNGLYALLWNNLLVTNPWRCDDSRRRALKRILPP